MKEGKGGEMGWGKGKGQKNESKGEEKRREIKDSRARGENGVKGGTEGLEKIQGEEK